MILEVSWRSFLIVSEKERERKSENRVNGHAVTQHISVRMNKSSEAGFLADSVYNRYLLEIQNKRDRIGFHFVSFKLLVNVMIVLYFCISTLYFGIDISNVFYVNIFTWNESRLVIIREKKGEELIDLFDRKEIYRDV